MLRSLVGSEMCIRDRSMGSPLSPILANIYMELLEHNYILPYTSTHNITWLRYVDDVFAAIPKHIQFNNLLNHINNLHPSITFTYELSTNDTLPFLDTLLTWHKATHITYAVYRKPSSNPAYTHWYSTHSCLLYTSDAADERSSVDL